MSTTNRSPRQTIERFLQAAVSPAPGDMADCYAEHFVIEMPFAGGLAPERTQTSREEFRARVTAGLAARRYTRAADVRIHETADPGWWWSSTGSKGTRAPMRARSRSRSSWS